MKSAAAHGTAQRERYRLRSRLRAVSEALRTKRCGVSVISEAGAHVVAAGRPGAWDVRWSGVLKCGHIWTCPVCSEKLRTERLQRIEHALEGAGGRWQMVTLTMRHQRGMPLKRLLEGMSAAWRRCKQGGAFQEVWKQRVSASVRLWDLTHGDANGWHPHIHVLIRTTDWDAGEKDLLTARWRAALELALGPECVPDFVHAVRWSTPLAAGERRERAGYLAKLRKVAGLELAGSGKLGKNGSRTPWQIAAAAGSGDRRSVALWKEYEAATKGKRMLELDDRAAAYAKRVFRECPDVPPPLECRRVHLWGDELFMIRRYEARVNGAVLAELVERVARCDDPEAVIRGVLKDLWEWWRKESVRRTLAA